MIRQIQLYVWTRLAPANKPYTIMKFNPHTNRLFTDDGRLIKQLSCPYRANWKRFAATSDPKARLCDVCDHRVMDTALMQEEEVVALMTVDTDACLKLDFYQENLTIIHHDAKPKTP